MKVLVVGCGSIAQRHITNLVKFDNIEAILIYTKVKNCLEVLGETKNKVKIVKNLNNPEVDFAIICNETHKHLEIAIALAQKGINLFIEKPLSYNLDNLHILEKAVHTKKIKVTIGYNLRFLGAIKYIKEQLNKEVIGDLYFAKIEAGYYLPKWRKNIKYTDSYSADKNRGGGVSLDLSHEIDYMRYFFGDPVYGKCIKAKVSKLKINSDDIFEALYLFNNNFICNIHLDYLQMDKKRKIRIVGSKGAIECDFIQKKIKIKKDNTESVIDSESYFDIDKTYIDELESFMMAVKNYSEPNIILDDGVKVLNLIKD